MPAPILQLGCTIQCPHGATVQAIPSQTRLTLGGAVALLTSDTFVVVGCPFVVALKPQPCVMVEWVGPAARVKMNGQAVLLQSSTGLCKSAEGIVQGTVIVSGIQTKVSGQ
ncbi:hypothetical protein P12x_000800 [Tundrisphaera lichenicola]|uniref:hypothetical protein n=1 Tax=Tundrisphaera lichenicola TaxID=2029860 RepID=UPI003EB94527